MTEPRPHSLCHVCNDIGLVWAPSRTFPRGFKLFCSRLLPRSEDRQHVEIVCPRCRGAGGSAFGEAAQ